MLHKIAIHSIAWGQYPKPVHTRICSFLCYRSLSTHRFVLFLRCYCQSRRVLQHSSAYIHTYTHMYEHVQRFRTISKRYVSISISATMFSMAVRVWLWRFIFKFVATNNWFFFIFILVCSMLVYTTIHSFIHSSRVVLHIILSNIENIYVRHLFGVFFSSSSPSVCLFFASFVYLVCAYQATTKNVLAYKKLYKLWYRWIVSCCVFLSRAHTEHDMPSLGFSTLFIHNSTFTDEHASVCR